MIADFRLSITPAVTRSEDDCAVRITEKAMNLKSQIENRKPKTNKVVVIAASAGGIDALTQVLSGLPGNLPAAILVVQHLRNDRPTRLPEHLERHSRLRVRLAQNGMRLEAGAVYVALPGEHIRIENGHIALSLEEPLHYVRPSADLLFISAAQAFGRNAIGVVLSGTGKDGAQGCQEIKAEGGMAITQDQETARYFDMPKAAINTGAIDYVLPVDEIAGKIVEVVNQKQETKNEKDQNTPGCTGNVQS